MSGGMALTMGDWVSHRAPGQSGSKCLPSSTSKAGCSFNDLLPTKGRGSLLACILSAHSPQSLVCMCVCVCVYVQINTHSGAHVLVKNISHGNENAAKMCKELLGSAWWSIPRDQERQRGRQIV